MKKVFLMVTTLNLVGCLQVGSAILEHEKATAIRSPLVLKQSTKATTSFLTDKPVKKSADCIVQSFLNYGDSDPKPYGDTQSRDLKPDGIQLVSKAPYNPKLFVPGNVIVPTSFDYNIDQILVLTEIIPTSSTKTRIDAWVNGDSADIAKEIIMPCL